MKLRCPYCGGKPIYTDSSIIYGRSYGMIYLCKPCDAYVGVHKGTDVPLGRLANKELRLWKKKAHAAFDPLWKFKKITRSRAYETLSKELNISKKDAHIGMFDVDQCKRVVEIFSELK